MWAGLGHPEPEVTSRGPAPPEVACRLPFKTLELFAVGGFHIKILISNFSRGQSETWGSEFPMQIPHLVPLHHSPSWLPWGGAQDFETPPFPHPIINRSSAPSRQNRAEVPGSEMSVGHAPEGEQRAELGSLGGRGPLPTLGEQTSPGCLNICLSIVCGPMKSSGHVC